MEKLFLLFCVQKWIYCGLLSIWAMKGVLLKSQKAVYLHRDYLDSATNL
ncbi:hypothetical protein OIU76_000989, partial [Salix suchowensis]